MSTCRFGPNLVLALALTERRSRTPNVLQYLLIDPGTFDKDCQGDRNVPHNLNTSEWSRYIIKVWQQMQVFSVILEYNQRAE